MMAACEPHAFAISSRATTQATLSAPLPPQRSGIAMPMSPSSPMRFTVSWGKRASRSISAAMGLIAVSANSRASAWIICCSADSSSFIPSFLEELLELLRQLRHDLEQVADDAVVGDLEDRRLRVLVDGDDHLRRAHAGQVLDRARDAEAHVELGRDGPAGLADLESVRPRSPPSGAPRSPSGRAEPRPGGRRSAAASRPRASSPT